MASNILMHFDKCLITGKHQLFSYQISPDTCCCEQKKLSDIFLLKTNIELQSSSLPYLPTQGMKYQSI